MESSKPFAHVGLQDLTFLGDGLKRCTVSAIFESSLPNLQKLHLGLSYEQPAKQALDKAVIEGLKTMQRQLSQFTLGFPCTALRDNGCTFRFKDLGESR